MWRHNSTFIIAHYLPFLKMKTPLRFALQFTFTQHFIRTYFYLPVTSWMIYIFRLVTYRRIFIFTFIMIFSSILQRRKHNTAFWTVGRSPHSLLCSSSNFTRTVCSVVNVMTCLHTRTQPLFLDRWSRTARHPRCCQISLSWW